MAQCTIVIPDETAVSEFFGTHLTTEAFRMPARLHCFDDTSDDDVAAFIAEWCVECAEISLAILSAFKFVEDAILKCSEALGAAKEGNEVLYESS